MSEEWQGCVLGSVNLGVVVGGLSCTIGQGKGLGFLPSARGRRAVPGFEKGKHIVLSFF